MRLLIVEDEKKLCDAIAKSLHGAGYEVDVCYDGDEALSMIFDNCWQLILRSSIFDSKSEAWDVLMNKKVRLSAIIVFIMTLIISIIRVFIDFSYGIDKISPLILVFDIVSVIVWIICIVVNCSLYLKKDK